MTSRTFKQKLHRMKALLFTLGFYLIFVALGCSGCGGVKKGDVEITKDNVMQHPSSNNRDAIDSTEYGDLKLTPISRKEVLDHFIYHVGMYENGLYIQKLKLWDGNKETIIEIEGKYQMEISPNQEYFTLAKLIEKSQNKFEYEVELRNFKNQILAKGTIPACFDEYYDEFNDIIYPIEDGSGFLQEGRRLGGDLIFSVYKVKNGKFTKQFTYDKTTGRDYVNIVVSKGIQMNENGTKYIVLSERMDGSEEGLELLDGNGKVEWRKNLDINYENFLSADISNRYKPYGLNIDKILLCERLKSQKNTDIVIFNKDGNTVNKIRDVALNEYFRNDQIISFIGNNNNIYMYKDDNIDSLFFDSKDIKLISNIFLQKGEIIISLKENLFYIINLDSKKITNIKVRELNRAYLLLINSKIYFEDRVSKGFKSDTIYIPILN
jgi:hypothetical protein